MTELGSLGDVSACFVLSVNERCTCVAVDGSNYNSTNHHEPIRKRNINLTMEVGARVSCLDLWEVGRVHELYEQLESAGDECL